LWTYATRESKKTALCGKEKQDANSQRREKKITALRGEKYTMVAPYEERNKMAALCG
jgi:hypothetical protein